MNAFPSTTSSPIAPLLLTDGYKVGHIAMYPEGTTRVYSNYTNRASRIEAVDRVVHFGLQAFCQAYLVEAFKPFFEADVEDVTKLYADTMEAYLGSPIIGADHIRALHNLGYLPLRISAVPEGTMVPLRVPSFTIENTHPDFFWLTNYIESAVSAAVWHASTTATIANQYRDLVEAAAIRTGVPLEAVPYSVHDFSFRGQTSIEAAAASGAGHMLSFTGSDCLPSFDWINRYYPGGSASTDGKENGYLAGSVPATEHSVMCAGISETNELETYRRLLKVVPSGLLSVVSDTFDLWEVCTTFLAELKDEIMGRDGKLVIRPDSGDPVDILCGTNPVRGAGQTPAEKGVIELLYDGFGGSVNEAGFITLDPHVGAIYGDSITLERAQAIVDRLAAKGFASSAVVLGVGSYTYQYVTRDTFASAIKATWAEVDGVGHNLLKDPVTDTGMKKSATGRLAVVAGADGGMELIEKATPAQEAESLIQPIWENGQPLVIQSFADVRDTLSRGRAAR